MVINVAPLLKQPLGTRVDYEVEEAPIDPRGENAGLLDADIVDIDALYDAMKDGTVLAAGLDVLPDEPANPQSRLIAAWQRNEEQTIYIECR